MEVSESWELHLGYGFQQLRCALAVYRFEQKPPQVSVQTLMWIKGSLFWLPPFPLNLSKRIFKMRITKCLWKPAYCRQHNKATCAKEMMSTLRQLHLIQSFPSKNRPTICWAFWNGSSCTVIFLYINITSQEKVALFISPIQLLLIGNEMRDLTSV